MVQIPKLIVAGLIPVADFQLLSVVLASCDSTSSPAVDQVHRRTARTA
jgi:hypothetical protein